MLIQIQPRHRLQHRIARITGSEQCTDILVSGNFVIVQTVHQFVIGGHIHDTAFDTLDQLTD